MSNPEFISVGWDNAAGDGFHGSGWYFWDETWSYCYGPYDSEKAARDALKSYARALDEPARHSEPNCAGTATGPGETAE